MFMIPGVTHDIKTFRVNLSMREAFYARIQTVQIPTAQTTQRYTHAFSSIYICSLDMVSRLSRALLYRHIVAHGASYKMALVFLMDTHSLRVKSPMSSKTPCLDFSA